MAREDFIEQLRAMGYVPEDRGDGKVVLPYTVETGKFAGREVRLGFVVAGDYSLNPPSCVHVSPTLLPGHPQNDLPHPAGGVHPNQSFDAAFQDLESADQPLEGDEPHGARRYGARAPAVRHAMTPSIYSAAIPSAVHERALAHLLRPDHQEDLCFAIWHPSQGRTRLTGLVTELVLPRDGERRVHGNASFLPGYFERAVAEAVRAKGGLAFLHSHLGPGWQDMSSDDIRSEHGHAAAAKGATGLPLLGLTAATDGAWSARFWEKTAPRMYVRRWCASVRVVGDRLGLTFHDGLMPKPRIIEEWRRTVSAWGEDIQVDLTRLHVGVVGAGSVGAIIAEALVRTGIGRVDKPLLRRPASK